MLVGQLLAQWDMAHNWDSKVLLLCTDGGRDLDHPVSEHSYLAGRARPSSLNYFYVEREKHQLPMSCTYSEYWKQCCWEGPASVLSTCHIGDVS